MLTSQNEKNPLQPEADDLKHQLEKDPAVVARVNDDGATLLHVLAKMEGAIEACIPSHLLWGSSHVNWRQQDAQGKTVLHWLAENPHRTLENVQQIIQQCADLTALNIISDDGNTPFDHALQRSAWPLMFFLLRKGADPFLTGASENLERSKPDLLAWLERKKMALEIPVDDRQHYDKQWYELNDLCQQLEKTPPAAGCEEGGNSTHRLALKRLDSNGSDWDLSSSDFDSPFSKLQKNIN